MWHTRRPGGRRLAIALLAAAALASGAAGLTMPAGFPRYVLFVGDSQCFFLGVGGFYQALADALTALVGAPVLVDFDCQSFRRFGPCYGQEPPDCEGVGTTEEMLTEWCTRQPNAANYTDVIMMIGVNNLKNIIWQATPATNEYVGELTGPETVVRDLGRAGDAMRTCAGADLFLAGPLNIQQCGDPVMWNACEDDITGGPGGPYWRSDWLQARIAEKAAEMGPAAVHVNTSGIEHPELFKDIFHTEHPKDVEAVVDAFVRAFASRFDPPLPVPDVLPAAAAGGGSYDVVTHDDECEKDWRKRGHSWCGVKNGILDRRRQEEEASRPREGGKDAAYDKKVIGVVVSAVGIFIILATWAVYDQSRRSANKAAAGSTDRARLVAGAGSSSSSSQEMVGQQKL